jgi:hypothetical protein
MKKLSAAVFMLGLAILGVKVHEEDQEEVKQQFARIEARLSER